MPDGLTFDRESHGYALDGKPIPSVTQILRDVGLIDTSAPWYTDEARELGSCVAIATEWHDREILLGYTPDMGKIPPNVLPYVEAWVKFLAETGAVVQHIEQAVCCRRLWYAGTYDRIIQYIVGTICTLLDIKTGAPAKWHQLQTAGYTGCVDGYHMRGAVYLKPDGKYKFYIHGDADDWPAFQSAVALAAWKHNHGVTNGNRAA